jgi:hypothetical protein
VKIRHAAVLALVGWYLMVLPQDIADGYFRSVPIGREWKRKAVFATEFDCNHEISKGCHRFQNGEVIGLEGPLCYARCVASDDPRLKGNPDTRDFK